MMVHEFHARLNQARCHNTRTSRTIPPISPTTDPFWQSIYNLSSRTSPPSSSLLSTCQSPHLTITRTPIQHRTRIYKRLWTSRIPAPAHFVSAGEVDATDVEAVDMRWQDAADKEDAVNEAVGVEIVEEAHGKWWEEDIEDCYADAIAEGAEHSFVVFVLLCRLVGL